MTELKPPTTEELLNVLRVHADAYPDSLSPFDVTEALVPPRPAPDGSPEQQLQQEQVLRVLQVHHHAVKAEYLAETVPATGEQGSRFGLTTPGMRWLDTNEPDEPAEDGSEDEPITIVRGPMPDLDDENSTPLHLWAVQGGTVTTGNFHVINSLRSALQKGEHGLSTVPGLLKRVLMEGSWREFVTERGEHVQHSRFIEFVTAKPMKGIGATVELVKRVVADDPEVLDLLDRELVGRQAHDHQVAVDPITGTTTETTTGPVTPWTPRPNR